MNLKRLGTETRTAFTIAGCPTILSALPKPSPRAPPKHPRPLKIRKEFNIRCHICNSTLSPSEVQFNKDHKDWDPCNTCQEEIDAVFNDDSEDEINQQLVVELDLDAEDQEMENEDGFEEKS